jgi:hypothetical protein
VAGRAAWTLKLDRELSLRSWRAGSESDHISKDDVRSDHYHREVARRAVASNFNLGESVHGTEFSSRTSLFDEVG